MKKSKHSIFPDEVEITESELKLVLGDSANRLDLYLNNIFCSCSAADKKLVDYKIYLNDLNDVILKGKCSGCMTIASRYIETGENSENCIVAERIKKSKKA